MTTIRIATWNLDHLSANSPRATACRDIMAKVHADIWVLTEVHHNFSITELPDTEGVNHPYQKVACTDPFSRFFPGVMVSIWARKDLHGRPSTGIEPTEFTTCAEFPIEGSKKLWVYGTVLPWLGSAKTLGCTFDKALIRHKHDWERLNWQDNGWLCVAGDFNQEYSASRHFYGSGKQEASLKIALEEADLECLTGGPTDPAALNFSTQEKPVANIDHICMGSAKKRDWRVEKIEASERISGSTVISDHHCVALTIEIP